MKPSARLYKGWEGADVLRGQDFPINQDGDGYVYWAMVKLLSAE
jgi:hypothetical protein